MLYMTIAKHISHPRCIIISDRPFKMLPFLHFNGRATSMAPIYGISLFIQVEFVGSGFANPCLFHGVNLLTFIYKSNKPASNIIPLGLFNASTKQVPFLLSPLLASPPSFTTKQVRRGCPCAAQSMARRADASASVLEIDPPCLLCVL